jgi:large subunit ribosomal protein L18
MSRARRKKTNIKSSADRLRLSVFRSNTNIFVQVIDDSLGKTVVSSNSLKFSDVSKTEAAVKVGQEIAQKSLNNNITQVVFDRGFYTYKGRVKALADAARTAGLKF